jgi:WbqC-like protein family
MRCAIMQPTFLPWAGYFRLMTNVDHFVLLDDVQLSRQSWQTRNRVLVNRKTHWVTVPIRHVGSDQTLNNVELAKGAPWRLKLTRLLRQSYSRHRHGKGIDVMLAILERGRQERLAELNVDLIEHCAGQLAIATSRSRSSEMHLFATDRTDRLIEICRLLQCDTYLSPSGSAEYLTLDGFTRRCDIRLEFAEYNPPPYPQRGMEEFVSHLSIIDVVANLGWQGAADYIRAYWGGMELTDENR